MDGQDSSFISSSSTTNRSLSVELDDWIDHRVLARRVDNSYERGKIRAVSSPSSLEVQFDSPEGTYQKYEEVLGVGHHDVIDDVCPPASQLMPGSRVLVRIPTKPNATLRDGFVEGVVKEVRYVVQPIHPVEGQSTTVLAKRASLRLPRPPWWEELNVAIGTGETTISRPDEEDHRKVDALFDVTGCDVSPTNDENRSETTLLNAREEPDQVQSHISPEEELDKLEKLKWGAEVHIRFSGIYLPMLRSMSSQYYDLDENPNPWKTLKEGSYYLGNAYSLVELHKKCALSSISDENIQTVDNILKQFEFDPDHISSGFTDEAYGGKANCFVSKGQGTKYYNILHSPLKKDVRSFIAMVEQEIDIPIKQFLQSINQKLALAYSENLLKAVVNDDLSMVEKCLKGGANVNFQDTSGRTALHHAVYNGKIHMVQKLLESGADVTKTTNKGNTPLHIATSKGLKRIVQTLIEYASRDQLCDFVDAKTTFYGTTSLHVAAKGGYLEIIHFLLAHGATYNIKNKEGKTPYNLSDDQKVTAFLKSIDEFFEDTEKGNGKVISKLKTVTPDEFIALMKARNSQGNTLLQIAKANRYKRIASKLSKLLRAIQGIPLFMSIDPM